MGNGTEDAGSAGPGAFSREDDEDWVVECSDDETYNPGGLSGAVWEPRAEDVKALYTRLAGGEALTLEWTCPGRRSPSPEKADNLASDIQEEPEQQKQEEKILPSGFDFDEDLDTPGTKPGFTPRRTPGSGQTPRSQKKRVASMDKIMNDILRHKKIEAAERKASPGRRPLSGTPTHRRLGALGGQRRLLATPERKQAPPAGDKSFSFEDSTEGGAAAPGETRVGQMETGPTVTPVLPDPAPGRPPPPQGSTAPPTSTAPPSTAPEAGPKQAPSATATPPAPPAPTPTTEGQTGTSTGAPVTNPAEQEPNKTLASQMGNLMSGNPPKDVEVPPQVGPPPPDRATQPGSASDQVTTNLVTAASSTTPQAPSTEPQSGPTPAPPGPTQPQVGPAQPPPSTTTTTPTEGPAPTPASTEGPGVTQEGPTSTEEGPSSTQEAPAPPQDPTPPATAPAPPTTPSVPVAPPSGEVVKPDSDVSAPEAGAGQPGTEPEKMETDSTDVERGEKSAETTTDVEMKDP